ncbi:MAG: YkgJ family cysteine cluster protein [Thaumarchaeota archaeon]|nr:YkgJ family cysteine cluster protein [Nitrososphaerota archaeon]
MGEKIFETDTSNIKVLSKRKEDENWEFRSFLKGCDIPSEEIDRIVHKLYKEISSEIDCTICGNCCREVQPLLDEEDVERLSAGSGISIAQFKKQYLVEDRESNKHVFREKPCPFLRDNSCLYYGYRPKDCASYPHLHKDGFIFRLIDVIDNCSVCPIAFNVYEQLKGLVWPERMFTPLRNR